MNGIDWSSPDVALAGQLVCAAMLTAHLLILRPRAARRDLLLDARIVQDELDLAFRLGQISPTNMEAIATQLLLRRVRQNPRSAELVLERIPALTKAGPLEARPMEREYLGGTLDRLSDAVHRYLRGAWPRAGVLSAAVVTELPLEWVDGPANRDQDELHCGDTGDDYLTDDEFDQLYARSAPLPIEPTRPREHGAGREREFDPQRAPDLEADTNPEPEPEPEPNSESDFEPDDEAIRNLDPDPEVQALDDPAIGLNPVLGPTTDPILDLRFDGAREPNRPALESAANPTGSVEEPERASAWVDLVTAEVPPRNSGLGPADRHARPYRPARSTRPTRSSRPMSSPPGDPSDRSSVLPR